MTTRCFLFETTANTIAQLFFVGTTLEFVRKDLVSIGLPAYPDPFALPLADTARTALVSQDFCYYLARHGIAAARFFACIRHVVDKVVLYDSNDRFALTIDPEPFDHADLVIKFQGLYKDRDLYQYKVGALYPGYHWGDRGGGTLPHRYSPAHLDKLRLSFPLFLANVPQVRNRRRIQWRGNGPTSALFGLAERAIDRSLKIASRLVTPGADVHHVGGLTHQARYDVATQLQDLHSRGLNVITSVPDYINGTDYTLDVFPWTRPVDARVRERFAAALRERHLLRAGPMPKRAFIMSMLRHKYVFATAGYGELTYRHAEAWQVGRAVICQDLSGVEILYPFVDNTNVIFCRPDLHDVPDIVRRVQADEYDWRKIGRQGRAMWEAWGGAWQTMFKASFEDLVR